MVIKSSRIIRIISKLVLILIPSYFGISTYETANYAIVTKLDDSQSRQGISLKVIEILQHWLHHNHQPRASDRNFHATNVYEDLAKRTYLGIVSLLVGYSWYSHLEWNLQLLQLLLELSRCTTGVTSTAQQRLLGAGEFLGVINCQEQGQTVISWRQTVPSKTG